MGSEKNERQAGYSARVDGEQRGPLQRPPLVEAMQLMEAMDCAEEEKWQDGSRILRGKLPLRAIVTHDDKGDRQNQ